MPDLATLQADMAQALLTGHFAAVTDALRPGPIAPEEALSVHRNTALYGLVNALRLSHPTVDALVGEAFFDQAALAFVAGHPPAGAWLTGYGEAFAAFLESYAPAAELAYLADVARLDFALEQAGEAALGQFGPPLDLGPAELALDASLRLIALDYPAAAIRDAIGDDERLAALEVVPRRHVLALWRLPEGVGVRALSTPSASFVSAVLEGQDPDGPLTEPELEALQAEVFAAPFARISPKPD